MANLGLVTNLTQVTEVFSSASLMTDSILGTLILFVVFFGLLMLLSAFNRADSFLAASFVTLVVSILLRYIGFIDDAVVLFVLAAYFASLAAAWFARSGPAV